MEDTRALNYGDIHLLIANTVVMGLVQKIANSPNDDFYLVTLFIFDLNESKKLNYYNDSKFQKYNLSLTKHLIQLLISKDECKSHKIKLGDMIEIVRKCPEHLYVQISKKI